MNTTRSLLFAASLLALTACSQTPLSDPAPQLAPLDFGTVESDGVQALARHSSGVYAVGYTMGDLHGNFSGGLDAFIRKYDSTGIMLWGKQFGTGGSIHAEDVASDSNNNAYVAGNGSGLAGATGTGGQFLRKYSPGGSVLWTRQYSSGDWAYEFGGVAVSGSSVYVVGSFYEDFQGDGPPPPSNATAFIRKFNSSGALLWSKTFGTSVDDWANDVAVDDNGNAYIVGSTLGMLAGSHGGDSDMFVRKYTPSGLVAWTRQLHRSSDYGVAVTVSGTSVYLAGWFDSQDSYARIVKFSTSGSKRWDRTFGAVGYVSVSDISATSHGVVFGGTTNSDFAEPRPYPNFYSDGFAYKLDLSGNTVWSKLQATSGNDSTDAVLSTPDGVFVAGETAGTLGTTYHGGWDPFLRRMKGTTGATIWTDQ